MPCKVIIAGAGPAGLIAAITAAGNGHQVTVLETLPSAGRKLLASGAGKCNFTNMLDAETMAQRFAPEQRRFIRPALLGFPPEAVRDFFKKRGVKCKLIDDFYCFPASEKAADILNVLIDEAVGLGVKIICSCGVDKLTLNEGKITHVTTSQGIYDCDYFIAAAGGPGFPALGGRGSLDKILAGCGVEFVNRTPALCGIKSQDQWVTGLAGIVLDQVILTLDKNNFSCGTLLFTGDGISGPAALDLSGRVAKILQTQDHATLKVNFHPDYSAEDWLDLFTCARHENGKKTIRKLIANILPQALSNALTAAVGVEDVTAANMSRSKSDALIRILTDCPFTAVRTESWEKSMASTGGAARTRINAKTLQSRDITNLYFAGEFIDVDGPCGGYNIQWALSSGRLAGMLSGNH